MILCSRAQKIKADYESATESFVWQANAAAERGDVGRTQGMEHQATGSRRAMAIKLNHHFQSCKECGP